MIDQLFVDLSRALSGNPGIALLAAFGWGIFSVLLSPCHLTSIPLIIGYLVSGDNINARRSFALAFVFSTGILITISLVGIVTLLLGRILGDVGFLTNFSIGIILIILGLFLMDIVPLSFNFFSGTTSGRRGFAGALILGLIFGIGLGPCTFAFLAPVLGLVFDLAGKNPLYGGGLLLAFALGHCLVIALAGNLTGLVARYLKWSENSSVLLNLKRVMGILVVLGGVYYLWRLF